MKYQGYKLNVVMLLTVSAIQQANSPAQLHISEATCRAVGNVKGCSHLEYSALDPRLIILTIMMISPGSALSSKLYEEVTVKT